MADPITNRSHWDNWATTHGTALRATTKCQSIKRLELEAVSRRLSALGEELDLLEVGCGNGFNGLAIAAGHRRLRYVGLDFSPEMIAAAVVAARDAPDIADRLAFGVGDARELDAPVDPTTDGPSHVGAEWEGRVPVESFDVVLTNRMLINLSSAEEQLTVMRRIAPLLRPGGTFLMLENSVQTHARLNGVRRHLGLPTRPAASYNVFIDEDAVVAPFEREMTLVDVEDFGAIHDLLLYAVEPALGDGEVTYDSPLLTKATEALIGLGQDAGRDLPFGQNRLWVWTRP
jgi:SAM-dependent methyltransferase